MVNVGPSSALNDTPVDSQSHQPSSRWCSARPPTAVLLTSCLFLTHFPLQFSPKGSLATSRSDTPPVGESVLHLANYCQGLPFFCHPPRRCRVCRCVSFILNAFLCQNAPKWATYHILIPYNGLPLKFLPNDSLLHWWWQLGGFRAHQNPNVNPL